METAGLEGLFFLYAKDSLLAACYESTRLKVCFYYTIGHQAPKLYGSMLSLVTGLLLSHSGKSTTVSHLR